MIGIVAVMAAVLFIQDNAEFIDDMNSKLQQDCTFSYTGKREVRDDVPHIAINEEFVYFTMEPCDE